MYKIIFSNKLNLIWARTLYLLTVCIKAPYKMTLLIMTITLITLSITTLSILTLTFNTLSIKRFSISHIQHNLKGWKSIQHRVTVYPLY